MGFQKLNCSGQTSWSAQGVRTMRGVIMWIIIFHTYISKLLQLTENSENKKSLTPFLFKKQYTGVNGFPKQAQKIMSLNVFQTND